MYVDGEDSDGISLHYEGTLRYVDRKCVGQTSRASMPLYPLYKYKYSVTYIGLTLRTAMATLTLVALSQPLKAFSPFALKLKAQGLEELLIGLVKVINIETYTCVAVNHGYYKCHKHVFTSARTHYMPTHYLASLRSTIMHLAL
jgi:hypothetical protein